MKQRDIKLLWGRSGNRCAMCRIEMTLEGNEETLGEMAHIVASSNEGPRGESDIPENDRDNYENLILLCPNHHTQIDKDPGSWSVEKLHKLKKEHEEWVTSLLGTEGFQVKQVDNSEYVSQQEQIWTENSNNRVVMVVGLTPLTVEDDLIDPLDNDVRNSLEQAQITSGTVKDNVNKFNTRTSENGLINERISDNHSGYSIEIYRSGHCHYLFKLGSKIESMNAYVAKEKHEVPAKTIIRYTDIENIAIDGITWLSAVWEKLLPFKYMTLTVELINTNDTTLFSREDRTFDEVLFGSRVNLNVLRYTQVLNKDFNINYLSFLTLSRFSQCYGLVLHELFKNGEFVRPHNMNYEFLVDLTHRSSQGLKLILRLRISAL